MTIGSRQKMTDMDTKQAATKMRSCRAGLAEFLVKTNVIDTLLRPDWI